MRMHREPRKSPSESDDVQDEVRIDGHTASYHVIHQDTRE